MAVIDHLYKDKPFIFKVYFGTEDVSDLILSIDGLTSELDITVPTSFQRPSVRLIMRDESSPDVVGWNPHNSDFQIKFYLTMDFDPTDTVIHYISDCKLPPQGKIKLTQEFYQLSLNPTQYEVISYSSRTDSTLTGLTRGLDGTTAIGHFKQHMTLGRGIGIFKEPDRYNLFTCEGYNASGYLCPVRIDLGYYLDNGTEDLETWFNGLIDSVSQNVKEGTLQVSFSDQSTEIRRDQLENIGETKFVALRPGNFRLNAEYPLPRALAPMSDESLTFDNLPGGNRANLVIVDSLRNQGELSSKNILPSDDRIESEGDFIDGDSNTPVSVEFKSPMRWRNLENAVKEILSKYNTITTPSVEIEETLVPMRTGETTQPKVPSTYGRVGYHTENSTGSGSADPFKWTGYVTDWIVGKATGDTNKFFFLYSSRNQKPKLLEYDHTTDKWKILVERSTVAEWWKLDQNPTTGDFYVIAIQTVNNPNRPSQGAYDPTETASDSVAPIIEKIEKKTDGSYDPLPSTFVKRSDGDGTNNYSPIGAAMYYHFGFSPVSDSTSPRRGIKPDTRRGFKIFNNELYYLYASGRTTTIRFGIAKVTLTGTKTFSNVVGPITPVGRWSHLSHDFVIDETPTPKVLYGGVCFQKGTSSRIQMFKKDL